MGEHETRRRSPLDRPGLEPSSETPSFTETMGVNGVVGQYEKKKKNQGYLKEKTCRVVTENV